MPGSMSFLLTRPQIERREKTVTRRIGWHKLKAGELLWAVEKVQGLKRGEKQKRLARIRIVDVRRERLDAIDAADCAREGFPEMTPAEFVAMFCKAMGCTPDSEVARIEFEYVADELPLFSGQLSAISDQPE